LEKAGLAPAFLFADLRARSDLLPPAAIVVPHTKKPLMIRKPHWKSAPVLPTFRA
jgi:hypothetical protein